MRDRKREREKKNAYTTSCASVPEPLSSLENLQPLLVINMMVITGVHPYKFGKPSQLDDDDGHVDKTLENPPGNGQDINKCVCVRQPRLEQEHKSSLGLPNSHVSQIR